MNIPAPSSNDQEARQLRAAIRATEGDTDTAPLWLRLRALVVSTAPLDALAISLRLFGRRAHQLEVAGAEKRERIIVLLPLRLQLTEDLLAAGYEAEAKGHFRKLLKWVNHAPLPADLSAYPLLNRWLTTPRVVAGIDAQPLPPSMISRFQLRAVRLLIDEPLIESRALVTYHLPDDMVRLLLPAEVATGPDRLVNASTKAFPALSQLAGGTPVQLRLARIRPEQRLTVFGVALRPQAPRWDDLPDQPGVVWRVVREPGVKRFSHEPIHPYVFIILRHGEPTKALLEHFTAAGLDPQPGDAVRVWRLPVEVKNIDNVVAVAPDPRPDAQLWRPFYGRLVVHDAEEGQVSPDITVFRHQLPDDTWWFDGALVEGIATLRRIKDTTQLVWRAACVRGL